MQIMLRCVPAIIGAVLIGLHARAADYDYFVAEREVAIAASADAAWRKIGDFCAIEKFGKTPCEIVSGSGGVGTIRRLRNAGEEPMIGQTSHSYTYEGVARDYDFYGTLSIESSGKHSSRATYTVIYDQARVPADKRDGFRERVISRLQEIVNGIKAVAEAK